MRQEMWSGPLPHPQTLQAFEDIAPGTAQKIVEEFQAEAAHRRNLENRESKLVQAETHIGQGIAIVFSLAALGVAAYAASVGAQWIGGIVGGGVIVSGIWALRRRISQSDQESPPEPKKRA
jgi:uncharacterized membrane protein